jgi:adenine-specific DNA-methyltransferase
MSDNLAKFQSLLRELFQFDCADLDFGIYRIMNHKRAVIERWITEDLPNLVRQELQQGTLAAQQKMLEELDTVREEIQKTAQNLGEKPFDADSNLLIWQDKPIGKKYIELREKAIHARNSQALEAAVYNHLYTFFSRYWQEGDFISRRRYSKKERYAIPYNGEEVFLYWANHDQYYIKTGEYFTDYTYKAPNGVTVHFKLRQADVEQNNVKGEKRFFLPRLDEITWDEAARQVVVPFEYRPLTAQEANGQKNQQEAIHAKAVEEIPKRVKAPEAIAALTAERRTTGNGETVPYLEYHLRQYTRRNTSDFFIHKDLKGFLSRELDFYLKNEVLNLEELEAAGEHLAEGWFQLLRLIKRIGLRIIEFLAQIEDFQKMLWEKKKFVTEVFYLVTVGNIPEAFYAEIAACEAQWDEWKTLFAIDEEQPDLFTSGKTKKERRVAFLKAHPTLVLDTRHFAQDFTDRLLASFDDLDESTDGLLVHAENWQALNLLQGKYRERVKCIYIDPPYNTAASEILYKNNYKHSSWITLMENRLRLGASMKTHDGVTIVAIDDTEKTVLSGLLSILFPLDEQNVVVVNHHPAGAGLEGANVSTTHEYAIFITPAGQKVLYGPQKKSEDGDRIGFIRTGTAQSNLRIGRPNSFYAVLVDPTVSKIVGAEPPPEGNDYPRGPTPDGLLRIYPVSDDGTERVWRRSFQSFWQELEKGNLECVNNKTIYLKSDATGKHRPIFSNWTDTKYNAGAYGTNVLTSIIGVPTFSYPKSIHTVMDCVSSVTIKSPYAYVIDYFAGSGTTGHAVINLNREDGGRRKFILVEMAQYFDTVLLPRIKKVTFTPEWKDGKPKRMATQEEAERSPRIVKVIRLESYEDALNNLTFDEESGQQALELFRDEYLLSYMLRWETRHSETLLNVERLQAPFSYKLHLHLDGETRERTVDLPETFAYLLGLDVQTRRVLPSPSGRGAGGEGRYLVYRGALRNGRTVVILWRDITGWGVADYEREAAFVAQQNLIAGADEIYVNGDSRIPGARSLDPIFKERMFAPVEA